MNIRTFTLNKLIQYIILLALLLTPIFSFYEVLALLTNTLISQTEALTPVYIKILKDVSFALLISLSIIQILRKMRIKKYFIIPTVLAGIILLNICFSLLTDANYVLILAGIRWSIPILLPFFLIGIVDGEFMQKSTKILFPVFVLHLILQIYQLFNMQFWFGINMFGLAARTPGIFLIPNTAAFFTIFCWFFFNYYGKFAKRQIFFVHIVAGISILLTMSGTGIIVYVLLLCIAMLDRRYLRIVLPLFPIVIGFLLLMLSVVVGRGDDYVETSGGTRIQIFVEELTSANLFASSFGIGTNTGVLLAGSNIGGREARIVDSTYASLIANTGLLGFALFIGASILWLLNAFKINRQDVYSFTIICGLFGATTIIFEAYPMNLLYAVCLAHFLPFRKVMIS